MIVNFKRSYEQANGLVDEICKCGGKAIGVQADVAQKPEVERMLEKALGEFGQIDILVNNAGVYNPATILDTSEEELDNMIAVNLKGILHTVQAVAPT